jgi:hypothetical protein
MPKKIAPPHEFTRSYERLPRGCATPHRVDGAVRTAGIVLDDLKATGTSKAGQIPCHASRNFLQSSYFCSKDFCGGANGHARSNRISFV